MPTPTKPANVIKLERKSHRTKAELRQRERAEEELLTGKILKESKETKGKPLAHAEFVRLRKLLKSIGKDDDLYGATINRYCVLISECVEFAEKRERFYSQMQDLENSKEKFEQNEDMSTYYKLQMGMQKSLISMDKQIQTKRKMLLDLEKENVMTIASSLRSIPKKPEKKRNALLEALNG